MIEQLQSTYIKTIKDENTKVVYKLIFKNALYSLESFREDGKELTNYGYIENLTEDEGEAEFFLKLMAKSQVAPIHIKDMAKDYFGR